MPRTPIDFSQTVIYKIVCNDLNILNVYVGSTTNMVKRRATHKYCCNNASSKDYIQKKYKIIRLNGGWDNWSMILIEHYPCNNRDEAFIRERYWMETLHATMNKQVPGRTEKEYNKLYHETHKDKINGRKSAKFLCECGGKFTHGKRVKHFRTIKHQNYINTQYEYFWDDGTPCTEADYYDSIQ